MVHPTPNRLVRHRHSALRQQILDVTQAEGEPEVKPYRLLDDLGRETIPAVADLVHPRGATRPPRTPQARSAVTMPPVVLPSPAVMQVVDAESEGRCAVGPQIIRDQSIRNDGVFPQKLAHQFQRGVLVAPGLDQHIQNLALAVDGAPQVNHAPIDFQIDLVKMPDRMQFGTALAQVRCNDRPEMIYP